MIYELNVGEVINAVCHQCPAIKQTWNGRVNGDWVSPEEYGCPCNEEPVLVLNGWDISCECRDEWEDDDD